MTGTIVERVKIVPVIIIFCVKRHVDTNMPRSIILHALSKKVKWGTIS
jgi:hypothetical protein